VETFDAGRLDPRFWVVTAEGDFREQRVDVVDVARRNPRDHRLRVRLDTRDTRDDTVKFLGVRSTAPIRLARRARVDVQIDWNDQANGSYLTAGVLLAPKATEGNPLRTANWLKVEYVGVPPGRNARLLVTASVEGRERQLHDEGWPKVNREGRRIAVQNLTILLRGPSFEVWENDRLACRAARAVLPFEGAHLYLQVSSHGNYPTREVFFDEIRVSAP